ncbi:acyl-CoA dehydrogenase [Steroidobacter denitrificans]|uniref:Acyl-CoA dehydrogenase n=1 Tax=Steroidobacter denitrificans TaxID=465721 RepID=A0A127F7K6_STEDE|nr:acyl-CoA dehydrogenase family protein [Steroidobacter denitrificans]AMN45601.1 acyl-CoA dehydrogenase [Steroidobacter denitrificans]
MSGSDTFRAEVRQWLEANCPPSMRMPVKTDQDMVWGGSRITFHSADQRLWFERMRDRGWLVPGWPKAYGGGGLEPRELRILEKEMRALGCRQPQYNLGIWMLGPVLLEFGTEPQKLEHLVPMARGEVRWCQGFSEPSAGSDLASLRTAAVRDGEDFVITGQKIWTSHGDKADWMYALVRTDPQAKKQQGISFILLDMKTPGIIVRPLGLISGKSEFCEVFFDAVRVPARHVIGGVNQGWRVAKKLLEHERAAMSTLSSGAAPSFDMLTIAKSYLDAAGPVWRDRVAAALMDQQAFSLTMRRLQELMLAREDASGVSSIMKLVQTEQESAKHELLQQLMGQRALSLDSEGFTPEELAVCRFWLYTKSYTIAGGSSEIQLNIIARHVLGLPT